MDPIIIIAAIILAIVAAYNLHRANRAEAALARVEQVSAEKRRSLRYYRVAKAVKS